MICCKEAPDMTCCDEKKLMLMIRHGHSSTSHRSYFSLLALFPAAQNFPLALIHSGKNPP
jgi:hypothetical protein